LTTTESYLDEGLDIAEASLQAFLAARAAQAA
jgi:hypothetical protein